MVPRHLERRLEGLRSGARLLDGAFRVPRTNRRFGWDPIVGLIPWLGDAVTLVFGAIVFVTAVQLRVPRVVQARILFIALFDFAVGLVPLAGDLVDFFYRANARNLALLEKHAYESHPPDREDWAIVGVTLGALALVLFVPLLVLALLLRSLGLAWI